MKLSKKNKLFILTSVLVIAFGIYQLLPSVSNSKDIIHDLFAEADIQFNGQRPWDIQVHDEAFYQRVLRDGSLGLGEAYMEGMWDCEALDQCIDRIAKANLNEKVSHSWPVILGSIKASLFNLQDKTKAKEVIDQHYQIGNELYQKMLDPSLTYSCGYWKDASNLEEAQRAKYDLICKKLYLKPGMKVLDIGCGWGGFAKHAADHYGVHVVGITLSENQAEYARSISQGLPVEIRLIDYRDMNEPFDRILEIGMFEHVGLKNYRQFMEVVHRCLKKDGLFLLHTIGANTSYLSVDPWIDKYIFPNGHLPSIAQIGESSEGLFVMEDWHNFGPYYDKTLLAWHDNFNKAWDKLAPDYGPTFYRMWNYYLLSCAGCFRARDIQLWQVVFSKNGVSGGYESVR